MKRIAHSVITLVVAVAFAGCEGDDLTINGDPIDPIGAEVVPEPTLPMQEPLVCAQANQSFETITPTVMLVVDQSGSMANDFGGTTRWNALYQTLMAQGTGVVQRLAADVRFGLVLYHSSNGYAGGQCPMLEAVSPERDNAAAIDAVYAPQSPSGDTPTGSTMLAAAAMLDNEPSPTFLVLATDGLPDTCEVPNPDGLPDAQQEVLDATSAAYQAGAPTYVLSVGPDVAEAHLQAVANAGAGNPPDGPTNAPYYVALDPDSLVDAFDDILDDVRFCTFTFDPFDSASHKEGYVVIGARVTLDGEELSEGSDWRLVGDDTVQLLGAACDDVLEGGDHDVQAELLCEMRIR